MWIHLIRRLKLFRYKILAFVILLVVACFSIYILLADDGNEELSSSPLFFNISDLEFLISNNNICKEAKNLTLIILIHSSPVHFSYRTTIRNTWANYSNYNQHAAFRRVFLFGKVSSLQLQAQIDNEHEKYGDILQGNFIDNYHNLTLNTLYGLSWVHEHCRNAKVVMKIDDDIVADMDSVLSGIVVPYGAKDDHVLCKVNLKEPIQRNKRRKHFVENNELKGLSFFPPYCGGKIVVFSSNLVTLILERARRTPLFWIEDVYVYGLVITKIPNLHIDTFKWDVEMDLNCRTDTKCITSDRTCSKLFAELKENIVSQIENVWKVFQERQAYCASVRVNSPRQLVCSYENLLGQV